MLNKKIQLKNFMFHSSFYIFKHFIHSWGFIYSEQQLWRWPYTANHSDDKGTKLLWIISQSLSTTMHGKTFQQIVIFNLSIPFMHSEEEMTYRIIRQGYTILLFQRDTFVILKVSQIGKTFFFSYFTMLYQQLRLCSIIIRFNKE
jgi:hypothetical protein